MPVSRPASPANAADGIFADSPASEWITPAGSVSRGYGAACQVAIALYNASWNP